MKTKYDKVAKHIRRLNELLDIKLKPTYSDGEAITVDLLQALKRLEDTQDERAFTSNAVDRAVEDKTEDDF